MQKEASAPEKDTSHERSVLYRVFMGLTWVGYKLTPHTSNTNIDLVIIFPKRDPHAASPITTWTKSHRHYWPDTEGLILHTRGLSVDSLAL